MPCKKAYLAAWRIANHDKVKADRLKWARDNPERAAENKRRWLESRPTYAPTYMQRWSADNPDKRRANEATRRDRIGGDKLPDSIKLDLFRSQAGTCPLCNQRLQWETELDHIVPLSKGGRNVVGNVQLVHPLCNRRKGVMLLPPPAPAEPQAADLASPPG